MAKEIPLSKGYVAIVDDEDYEWLNRWKWCYSRGYAMRMVRIGDGRKRVIRMHRLIMGVLDNDSVSVDHINRNKADNRKSNLRICDTQGNNCNVAPKSTSLIGYKGVSKLKHGKNYCANIERDGVVTYIGTFPTAESAACAYNHYAKLYHGEFAYLNDVPEIDWKSVMYKKTFTYKGAWYVSETNRWRATIAHNKKKIHIGYFDTEIEAALAYNAKAIELLGDNAKLNIIEYDEPNFSQPEPITNHDNTGVA